MSSDASTLPLREAQLEGPKARRGHASSRRRKDAATGSRERAWIGAASLMLIVACAAFVVVMAANRPSVLSATTHTNFFPPWMAGPLGGLWPGLTRSSTTLKYLFSGAIALMYVSYLLALAYVPRLRGRWAIATIVAVHAIFLLAPPMALTDVFNYVNYGRMEVVHHLNPYTSIPILEPHSDPSYDLSNWHQLLSPYGPLFTLLTFVVVPLGVASSFWVIKGLLAAASLGTIFLVWKCARLLGRDPIAAIVLVGLNPIVLVWGLGGDHNDFLMVFLIVLGFYLLLLSRDQAGGRGDDDARGPLAQQATALTGPAAIAGPAAPPTQPARAVAVAAPATTPGGDVDEAVASDAQRVEGRRGGWLLPLCAPEIGAGATFVTAAAIKASGAVLIPVVIAGLMRTPKRLLQVVLGMVVAGLLAAGGSLIAFGLHIPDLSTQSRLVTNVSIPNLLGLALGQGGLTTSLHTVLNAILLICVLLCCVQAWRRRASITASGWASVALLVTLSWVLPWYVLWVLPLAALSGSRRLRITALVLGAYFIIAWAPASGQLWNAIGFHPDKTPLGRLHQRYVKELLN